MNLLQKIESALAVLTGKINWGLKNPLTIDEKSEVNALLVPNYYIILTRNNNHLSSYCIGLADFFLRGKFGYWGHALMNLEDTVVDTVDFRFVEAIGTGVQYATFDEVMGVNSIVLLKPKHMHIEDWTLILDTAKSDVGKPYDTLFDLKQAVVNVKEYGGFPLLFIMISNNYLICLCSSQIFIIFIKYI